MPFKNFNNLEDIAMLNKLALILISTTLVGSAVAKDASNQSVDAVREAQEC